MIAHYKFILQLQQNLGRFNRTKWEQDIDSYVVQLGWQLIKEYSAQLHLHPHVR